MNKELLEYFPVTFMPLIKVMLPNGRIGTTRGRW